MKIKQKNRVKFLQENFLKGLEYESILNNYFYSFKKQKFVKGSIIFNEGEENPTSVFLIQKGNVEVFFSFFPIFLTQLTKKIPQNKDED